MQENKEAFVAFRATEAEREKLKKESEKRGMTLSGMIRLALRKAFRINI